MADDDQRWKAVGDAIGARIAELSLLFVEVQRAADISDKTLKGYIAGQPIRRVDKARGLCRALGWSDDSVTRILNGERPVVVQPDPRTPIHLAASTEEGVDLDELLEKDPEAYEAIMVQARIALDRARERRGP